MDKSWGLDTFRTYYGHVLPKCVQKVSIPTSCTSTVQTYCFPSNMRQSFEMRGIQKTGGSSIRWFCGPLQVVAAPPTEVISMTKKGWRRAANVLLSQPYTYNIIWVVCVREMETAVGHARYHAPLHLAPLSGHNDRGEPEAPPLLLSLFLAMRSYVQPHPVQTKFNSNKGIQRYTMDPIRIK